MKLRVKSKKGLSTVVTTLIILVVAVLLATVVTYYAMNVVMTRTQEESLQIYRNHIWHNGTTFSEVGFIITNTGGRDLVIDKISVRGQECDWDSVYYNKTQGASISADLVYIRPTSGGTLAGKNVTLDGTTYTLVQASNQLILKSSWSMIVYVTNPDSISVRDIGTNVGLTIFTANGQYYKECSVAAAT